MVGIRQTRFFRHHSRVAVVWVAIPLVVFNGRTLVGCGCTGHFESVCRCNCCPDTQEGGKQHGKSTYSCCTSHGFSHSHCACCNRSELTHHSNTADNDCCPAGPQELQGHHCNSIVLHDVIPGTVAPSTDTAGLHASILVSADF